MQKPIIPNSYDHLFDDLTTKLLAEYLAGYVLFDEKPKTTPALWQDAEIFIRYKKRDVWSLTDKQLNNAKFAILIYQIKYIISHLTKSEITKILNKFFTQENKNPKSLIQLFEIKFHAPIDSLFLIQEKIIIDKNITQNFNKIFDYPCWVEFTDNANETIFKKILNNKLTDEQIDYFLGASDTLKNYDKWFRVVKHILLTTKNSHTFWTAGDILSIIWKAAPKNKKSEKWFKDQIFEIFWPRVQSTWPMQNKDKIDFEKDDASQILKDSINWLRVLDDLKERLPELGNNYQLLEYKTDETNFSYTKGLLLGKLDSNTSSITELMDLFFALADYAYDENCITELQNISDELIHIIKTSKDNIDAKKAIKIIERAIKHAKNYLSDLKRERQNIAKRLIKTN